MNLKHITQNKVSQKEKNKLSYINAYMWDLQRWDAPICRAAMETET